MSLGIRYNKLLQAGELERLEQEITVSIQDIGLSLVNNFTQREQANLEIQFYLEISAIQLRDNSSHVTKRYQQGNLEMVTRLLRYSNVTRDISFCNLEIMVAMYRSDIRDITSSKEKRKRFKALNIKTTAALEMAYQKWDTEKLAGRIQPERLTIDKMEVRFVEISG
ncbi:hypothetical protein DPMN_028958 [Dreissena polymorpha]|uniref:Uncharacterized protein n=1 Tax=Dreissena polymorpha TaxID=45954 RepID=A0A9D4LXP2_DREPO|nr:hypothetical protein DPMN_028958 [Dreissena polymorpha]